ncbi:Ig-like domain-containing protein [Flagellimonas baculiformis]|uniref:Ig-like domain-containing protein n=1 Tax=Flagellimonas baculiformis TaxID=3067310 RepID=UPI00296F96CD|nr:Ig-like domain-containing protein [Muricauda sp. D6]
MKTFFTKITVISLTISLLWACGKDDSPEGPYDLNPTIASFEPTSGKVGMEVVLSGKDFGSNPSKNIVKFGNVEAKIKMASVQKIWVEVPEGAVTGKISVTANGKTVNTTEDFVIISNSPESIELDNTELVMYPYPFYAKTLGVITDISGSTVEWSSSDVTVATVDENGNIMPLGVGETTITATVGEATAECTVIVKDGPITKMELDLKNLDLYSGQTAVLTITTLEAEVEETSPVVWTSDDTEVAQVDEEGNIIGLKAGKAVISATIDNATASCTVNVLNNTYAVGHEMEDNVTVATIWTNGVAQKLTDGTNDANAYSVFMDGTDIYVAGQEYNGSYYVATLWVNGVPQQLTDGTNDARAESVYVADGNVYVGGFESNGTYYVATVWVNGVPQQLADGNSNSGVESVYVYNGDIYAGGYENIGSYGVASIWKNGVSQQLTDGSGNAKVLALQVLEGDVYASGYEYIGNYNVASLWKNGQKSELGDGTSTSFANALHIHDGTEYVAGLENNGSVNVAFVWANGIPTELTDGTGSATATSISVVDGNIYVAGYESNGSKFVGKIWKNGEEYLQLTDGTEHANIYSMVVK